MPEAPTMIAGRYRLGEAIGSGGMGRVWLAHDERLDRDVAIKEIVLPPGSEEDAAVARRRTLREARAAARLNHHGVVGVYDVFEADGKPWIVMEHVPSRSLKEIVQEDGPLDDRQAAVIGLEILEALRAAHKAGVQHRDVKPANVLIADDGRVVLTDFGIATIEGDGLITSSGQQLHASLDYMAPERAQEGEATEAADLWSLGATLYDAVEGRAPFHRASAVGTLTAIAADPPDPMERAGALAPVIDGLLKKNPGERLTSADAGRLLQAAAEGKSKVARATAAPIAPARKDQDPPGGRPGPARPLIIGAAAVAVVLVVTLVAFVLTRPDGTGDTPGDNIAAPGPTASAGTPSAGPSDAPASQAVQPSPVGAPTPSPTGQAAGGGENAGGSGEGSGRPQLPQGWRDYTDPTGFKVYVPNGWTQSQDGTMVYFTGPTGRVLGVDQTNTPKADPVADWSEQRDTRIADGDFPGYSEVKIVAVDYFQKAADWEWTYDSQFGRVHVNNRGVVTSPTQAYGIYWQTPESDWNAANKDLQLIFDSFVPKP
ncbi:tRNA A-37 threonylcarbamoyl transferase component Bud32 [Catenuloplanes nepalensis]|uniref:non-specific serine/threonine protein kinase n=1 Tax=Catenuloplanes nepalensis TaxID=587533 RepID=A0ABT9MUZ8_9ACTN|nr:serine/threonine-protein kinase [Catenuloplanes nepalensis]MDP9795253.1 tRNA A-37 threonylcarbamoyl transferase component Bud32 [Catenuloplanes nepalensis]